MSTPKPTPRHRTFISYHDGRPTFQQGGDYEYRVLFEKLFGDVAEAFISRAVQDGDLDLDVSTETTRQLIRDRYLRDTSVTVVLVGARTWQRKHVDWEIGSSVRDTPKNSRSGLLGILLPTYPGHRDHPGHPGYYDPHTIPPRLYDNVQRGFAKLYGWTTDPSAVRTWIHDAFQRRNTVLPNNSRAPFGRNWTGERWTP